jgi:hypothetical protein
MFLSRFAMFSIVPANVLKLHYYGKFKVSGTNIGIIPPFWVARGGAGSVPALID